METPTSILYHPHLWSFILGALFLFIGYKLYTREPKEKGELQFIKYVWGGLAFSIGLVMMGTFLHAIIPFEGTLSDMVLYIPYSSAAIIMFLVSWKLIIALAKTWWC